jgi:hypothetical protein
MELSRRGLLAGALTGGSFATVGQAHANGSTLDRLLEQIVEEMRELHGGDWRLKIDHSAKMIAINQVQE